MIRQQCLLNVRSYRGFSVMDMGLQFFFNCNELWFQKHDDILIGSLIIRRYFNPDHSLVSPKKASKTTFL